MATSKFFISAMNYFMDRFNDVVFVVCCDDTAWCRNNIVGKNVVYSDGHSSVEDLAIYLDCATTL